MRVGAVLALVALVCLGCGGDDAGGDCDLGALRSELAGASPGATVAMGACVARGELLVPAGVSLVGSEGSAVDVSDGVGVRLEPSMDAASPTTVRGVDVHANGRVGILARGEGHVSIVGLTVSATRGYAVGVEAATAIALDGVTLQGTVTADNASDEAFVTPDAATMPTYGLVLLGVGTAAIDRTYVSGFAEFGAVVLDTTTDGTMAPPTNVTWTEGKVSDTLGTGLYFGGAVSTLTDVEVLTTHRGLRGTPTYGAFFTGDASDVTTVRLRVCDNADFGLLQEGGVAAHTDLEVTNNGTGGVAAGRAMGLSIGGSSSILSNNGAFNVLVRDSRNVTLRDAEISSAISVPSSLASSRSLGDGVQLVQSFENILLENLVIRDNPRAALIVDVGTDGGAGITFTNVMVHSREATLGVGGGMVDTTTWTLAPVAPDGTWDAGIVRDATAMMVDVGWTESLPVAGILTPTMIARPEGVAGILTPTM